MYFWPLNQVYGGKDQDREKSAVAATLLQLIWQACLTS